MNFTNLTVIRNLFRNLGITRLLSLRSIRANKKAKQYYTVHNPKTANISLLGFTYQLNTRSAYEWMRANAVYHDKKIIQNLLHYLKPGMDCWDIGASIGAYSCILALKNIPDGVVYAFEPELESKQKLWDNLQLNNLSNVIIYDVALGKEEKQLHLVLADDATAGTHKLDETRNQPTHGSQPVNVTTADKLISRDNLKVPAVIKIDVEGYEEQVLLGALMTIRDPACKAIMIEMHFSIYAAEKDNGRAGRIAEILKNAGFNQQKWVDASHLLAYK